MKNSESDNDAWRTLQKSVENGEVHEALVPYINRQLQERGIIALEEGEPGADLINPHLESASRLADEYIEATGDASAEGINDALTGVAETSLITSNSAHSTNELLDAVIVGAQEPVTFDNPIIHLEHDGIVEDSKMTDSVRTIYESGATDIAESAARIIETAQGSLPPSWRERSISSEFTVASSERSSKGGNIADTGWQPGLKIDKIPVSFPIGQGNATEIVYKSIDKMSNDELESYGIKQYERGGTVDFEVLSPEVKQAYLSARMMEIETESQSSEARLEASQRNLERVEKGIVVQEGDVLHGFDSSHLRNILNTGLLPGELVGKIDGRAPMQDALPYNLDGYDAVHTNSIGEHGKLLRNSTNSFYGDVTAIIDRKNSSAGKDHEVLMIEDDHELIFAGVPSTDIRALQLSPVVPYAGRDAEMAREYNDRQHKEMTHKLENVVNTIVAEGVYIPIYDGYGNLALSYDQYNERRENLDYHLNDVNVPESDIIELSKQYSSQKKDNMPTGLFADDNNNETIL